MYQHFYRLKADPFRLSPDHNFCYRHPSFARGRAYMKYALTAAEGFVVVTGKPGMGKTTLINDLLAEVGSSDYLAANVVTTTLEANDLLRAIAYEFGLPVQGLDKATVIQELKKLFVFSHQTGRPPLLIVDEAQNLTLTALEELRLLTNLNFDNRPLLQIFLLGQDELRHKLQDPQLEQLRQRVTAAARLEPLTAAETKAYVVHRLRIVGWNNFPQIDIAILPVLHGNTEGIPRRINQFCNRLLLLGAAEEKHRLTAEDARLVARELSGEGLTQPAASAPVDDDTDPIGEDCFGAELFTAPPVTPEPATPATPTDDESPPAAAAPEAAPPAPSIERAEPSGRPAAGLRNPQQDPRDPPMGPPIRLRPAAPPPPSPTPPEQTPQAPPGPAVARATAPRASRPPPDPGGPPNTGSRRPAFEDDLDRPPRRPHRVAIGVALAVLMVAGLLYLGSHIHLDAWTGNGAAPAAPATTADITPPPTAVPSPIDTTTASEMPTQTAPTAALKAPEATDTLAGSNTPLTAEVPLADHATAVDAPPPAAAPIGPDDAPANPPAALGSAEPPPEPPSEPLTLPDAPSAGPATAAAAAEPTPTPPGTTTPPEPTAAPEVVAEVQFAFDSHTLGPDATQRLDAVAVDLEGRALVARLVGYTDEIGDPQYNRRLSEQRAEAVRQYLVRQGVPGDRLEVIPEGGATIQVPDTIQPPRSRRSVQVIVSQRQPGDTSQ